MGSVKLKIDWKQVAAMTEGIVQDHVAATVSRAGDGFTGSTIWTDRPHGAVYATNFKARRRNARENTLLKAVQG